MLTIEDSLKQELDAATGVDWVREYRPCGSRRWRIDLAVPDYKIAVEIEGRRHGSAKAAVNDSEKNNFLISAGWKTLRYPASRVLTKKRRAAIIEQIHRVLCGVHDPDLDPHVLTGQT